MPNSSPIHSYRCLINRVFWALLILSVVAKAIEFSVFLTLDLQYNPYSFLALFLALWLFDADRKGLLVATIIAVGIAVFLQHLGPNLQIPAIALGCGSALVLGAKVLFPHSRKQSLTILVLGLLMPI